MGPSAKAEQAERRDVLRNEQQTAKLRPGEHEPSTFHAMANLDTSLGGRFAKADYVAGEEATTGYPRLPSSSPWAGDPIGIEPPIDATDCGVAFGEVLGGSVVVAPASIPGSETVEASSPSTAERMADPPIPIKLKRRRIS